MSFVAPSSSLSFSANSKKFLARIKTMNEDEGPAEGGGAVLVLTNPHKLLLQYFIAQHVVSKKDLKAKCKQISEYYRLAGVPLA